MMTIRPIQPGLLVMVGLFVLALPTGLLAHDRATAGPIKATVHVDPSDSPVIGQPATIQLLLERGGQRFDLAECRCTLTIIKNKTPLSTVPLVPPTDATIWSATVPFTFPSKDTYTLVVAGTPSVDPDAFKPFTLKTVFQIRRTNQNQPAALHDPDSLLHYGHFVLPGFAAGYLVFALIQQAYRRRSTQTKS